MRANLPAGATRIRARGGAAHGHTSVGHVVGRAQDQHDLPRLGSGLLGPAPAVLDHLAATRGGAKP